MLRLLEHEEQALLDFCKRDVFGTKIAAYFATYGTAYPFAVFYLQVSSNSVTAAICKIDDAMTLCCEQDADFEELAAFVSTIGFNTLMCTACVSDKLNLNPQKTGFIVEFQDEPNNLNFQDVPLSNSVELSDVYDVLKHAGFDGLPEKRPWLADVVSRVKNGTAKAMVVRQAKVPVACAMVLFETPQAVLIGAVATVPAFRGKGYAGALVTSLAVSATANSKRVELLCVKNSILEFYKRLGFVKTGEWALIVEREC